MTLLQRLAEAEGYTSVQAMLIAASEDSVVPAICTKCFGVEEMEPDQDRGWCSVCEQNTVKSCLILAGVI